MTRCLITGISGSIGFHVWVHAMHNTDWEVVGLDSMQHMGLSERLAEGFKDHPDWIKRTKILCHDLTAPIGKILYRQIGAIDHVINLASLSDVKASIEEPETFILNNTKLMLNMLEWARLARPDTFLHVSSDEVYGPTNGTYKHKEWDAIVPSSPYSAAKACQESIAIGYWRSFGVPLIIVNCMNNFSEMQNPDKFPAICMRKLANDETVTIHGSTTEHSTRYYMHSRNTADAFLYILRNCFVPTYKQSQRPARFHVVGEGPIRNIDLAAKIARHMKKTLTVHFVPFDEARPGHDQHYGLDGGVLARMGWLPPVDFEQSLKETVTWYLEHPEWLE